MKITLLGTGTAVKLDGRGYAGVHIEALGEHWLFDAGPGTLTQLSKIGVTFLDLHRLFLTHHHPDHCLDMVSILFAMRIPQPARKRAFWIYGPKGTEKLYQRLNKAFQGWIAPKTYPLKICDIKPGTRRFRRGTVKSIAMSHSTTAFGYRISIGGRQVAYSGDTEECEAVVELGRNCDVLILECSVPDEAAVPGHLTPSACGRIAQAAGCKHLVLTHFYPVFQNYPIARRVKKYFDGELTLATDLTQIEL